MKFKVAKREIRGENYVLGVGYCKMQSLLAYLSPVAYSVRAEGWACDYYDVDGVIISTGYSPIKSKNMIDDSATIMEYEGRSCGLDAKQKRALLSELLNKLKIK